MQTYCASCFPLANPLGFTMWSTKLDHASCGGDKPQMRENEQDNQLQETVTIHAQ